jgi:hypothetical protein
MPALATWCDEGPMTTTQIKPVRIQRSRKRGTRLSSPNGLPIVCVTRPGPWANPFKVSLRYDAEKCVELFERHISSTLGADLYIAVRRELRGKNLACWCKPGDPCHADVLLEIANA